MKYVLATIASLVIVILFSIVVILLGGNLRDLGPLPALILFAAWFGAWQLIKTRWPDKETPTVEQEISLPVVSANHKLGADQIVEYVSSQDATEMSEEERLAKWPLLDKSEEDLYAMAHFEFQGEGRRPGLWAKCIGEALGEEKKAEALYIKYRVQELMAKWQEEVELYKRVKNTFRITCPNCSKQLQYTKDELIHIASIAERTPRNWII